MIRIVASVLFGLVAAIGVTLLTRSQAHSYQDRTTCVICRGPLIERLTLRCGHSACTKCYEAMVISGQTACPCCKNE